jgi:glycosyltransferase involved in cell wall biosynthesis
MTPRVAVIVPAFRAEMFLGATLASVRSQTFGLWECVIVDDGSPDRSGAIAEQYVRADQRFRMVRKANGGVATARNLGLAEVSACVELVTFMDADDVYLPQALERLVGVLDSRADVVACHGLGDFIDESGHPVRTGEFAAIGRNRITCTGGRISPVPLECDSTFANVVTASSMFPPGLLLTRRRVLDEVGGFDVDQVGAEDWDIYIRIARRGPIAFVDEVLLGYRRHSSNQGARSIVPEMCRRVFHKAFYSAENTPEQHKIIREAWRATQRSLIGLRCREAMVQARTGRLDKSLLCLGRLPFIAARFLRGRPTHGWF